MGHPYDYESNVVLKIMQAMRLPCQSTEVARVRWRFELDLNSLQGGIEITQVRKYGKSQGKEII